MITAEQARKNLVPVEDVLKDYLAKEIEPAIIEASYKRTGTAFELLNSDKGWRFNNLTFSDSWGAYSFDKVKFSNAVVDALKRKGYKTEVKGIHSRSDVRGWLDVSWGKE